jgi:DNA invertase Pin-like site-specific DNA recombinase
VPEPVALHRSLGAAGFLFLGTFCRPRFSDAFSDNKCRQIHYKRQRGKNGRFTDDKEGAQMTSIGYMRVSKADGSQTLDLQRDALTAAGVDAGHIYEDQASGKRDDRPGLEACLKALRKGDVLVVWKLDRLGRSLPHLVQTIYELDKRGVGFRVLTGAPIDTTTAAGKLTFAIFAGLAEFERELIRERTMAGLASARARGRVGGRPPALTKAKLRLAQAAMGKPETKVAALAKELGVSKDTLYQYVSPNGELREAGRKLMGANCK